MPGNQATVPVTFVDYGDESDPGPYPVPLSAPIEGGSDRHVLAVDRDHCKLYEMFAASPQADHWDASSGAVFDLRSNALRPDGWTSADAAGLPDLPRARALRRGRERPHRPRAAVHGLDHAARLHPPGDALRVVEHEPRRCRPWAFASG